IGVMVDGRLSDGQIRYSLAVTNGEGANKDDINGTKSYTGRVEFLPADDVRISGNVGAHDYFNAATGDETALAFGGDVEYGNFNEGLHLQAGVVTGDNWRVLDAITNEPSSFMAAQGIITYKHPIEGNDRIAAIEPVARLSWADPDTGVDADHGMVLTPGFVVHFAGRNKMAVNVDVWMPNTGNSEMSLKVQSYLHF
ncbi:MAG: hypothetical protein OEY63_02880, partial [Gemmatimonadota bacterium]|nr:hypothetical protein [Gemmatimonadota bacterium]